MADRYRYLLALLPSLLLWGCADSGPPTATAPPAGQAPPVGSPTGAAAVPGAPVVPGQPGATQTSMAPGVVATPLPDPSFTPLPSPEQVKRAQPIGQLDPFRPLTQEIRDVVAKAKSTSGAGAASGSPSARPAPPPPLAPPPDFDFTGLIGGVGQPEAVVTYKGASGTLRVGDVGSAAGAGPNATYLLPDGWRVAKIDLNRGAIVLEFKGRTTTKTI